MLPIKYFKGITYSFKKLVRCVSRHYRFQLFIIGCILIPIPIPFSAKAQHGSSEYWMFLTSNFRLNERIDLLTDAQRRSENHLAPTSTILLRAGVAYNINDNHAVAIGYAFKGDWESAEDGRMYIPENRIYQQYQYEKTIGRAELEVRTRLEERFIQENETQFSLRARLFASIIIPVFANSDFSKGPFVGLQDEIFLNVWNKQHVNNHVFDQLRPYVSVGYRYNPKMESSFEYGRITEQNESSRQTSNIFRLSLTTSF